MHDDVARNSDKDQAISSYKENTVVSRILKTAKDIKRNNSDSSLSPKNGSASMMVAVAEALKISADQE